MSAFFTHSHALSYFSIEGKSWAFLWKHCCAMSLTSQGLRKLQERTGLPWAHPQALAHLHLKPFAKINSCQVLCRNCATFCTVFSLLDACIFLLAWPLPMTELQPSSQLLGSFYHITLVQANNTHNENLDQVCRLGFFYPVFAPTFQQQNHFVVIVFPLPNSLAAVRPFLLGPRSWAVQDLMFL